MSHLTNSFRADLHCHTTCSDGSMSPGELIQLACQIGLQGLSITDHDTIEAYGDVAVQACPIALIPGLELSAVHDQTSVHVLAYSFAPQAPPILEFCKRHQQRREERNRAILNLLSAHGMPLAAEDLSVVMPHTIGRPHIALAMMKRGYVHSIQEAFQKYIGEGRPCFALGKQFSVEETIEIIHRARGLAIIAHPHLIKNSSVLHDLLNMPFDGIEGYYSRFPPTEHERWVKIGAKRDWIVTGGSDFHGEIKPDIPLGCSWVGQETFQILQNHYLINCLA